MEQEKNELILDFGKYKNKHIDEIIDKDYIYVQWLYIQNNYQIPEIKKYIFENLKIYKINFGKFKGKDINEIPKYYIKWLIENIKDNELFIKHLLLN
jgi:uncharacterized protein (DUF3820 family)